jgi:hypothetical protein
MRPIIAGAALIACLPALTARAASELSHDQIVVAMAVDTAIFAAERCPRSSLTYRTLGSAKSR